MIDFNLADALQKSNFVKGPYGKRFGRLTVLYNDRKEISASGTTIYFDMCQCDCGAQKAHRREDLKRGVVQSCGCLRKELVAKRAFKHGLNKHPLQSVRQTMIQRCHNPKATGYKWYGAMGVKVCDRWQESLEAFVADVGERPIGMTLDRIDPYGDYEPGNVRWADRATQLANKRKVRAKAKGVDQ